MRSQGVAAVDRALSIVAVFEGHAEPLTLAELSRRTTLYKSTLLRLLASLERFGYVVRLRDGRYHLGPAAFRLGYAFERAHRLRDHIMPVLHELVRQGTESPSFHVRQDAETRLCLFRVNSAHSTLDRVSAGDVLPLRRGAAGKALLAFDAEPGPELDRIRESFVATSFGERDRSCAGVACPVFGADNKLRGALSLSGPRERFTETAVEAMTLLLLEAAVTATRSLGGDPSELTCRIEQRRRAVSPRRNRATGRADEFAAE